MKKNKLLLYAFTLATVFISCEGKNSKSTAQKEKKKALKEQEIEVVKLDTNLNFSVNIQKTGRYRIFVEGEPNDSARIWLEDYVGNPDRREYNISGWIDLDSSGKGQIDGSPLAKGEHSMKLHAENTKVSTLSFELMKSHSLSGDTLQAKMEEGEWKLLWSDEFEGKGLVDTTKWTYNVGNWGWGNHELQYYTEADLKNARQENGTLIIEAHPVADSKAWTSARLTTEGKVTFLYGRVEFRAKVPHGLGTWAAGWLLGDDYRDERSWPYCGEIDVLECVGYEIDSQGNGINHASCHTPAYYFKKGNHITGEIELDSMTSKFHTYAIEWYPDHIKAFLDGNHYYSYDKTANELEWPFFKPQNLIINLAIGGGWGGAKGVNQEMGPQQYVLDYIRVYEKQ